MTRRNPAITCVGELLEGSKKPADRRISKMAHNICYGKYMTQYQYVTSNLNHCHAGPNGQFSDVNPVCGRFGTTRTSAYPSRRIADSDETVFLSREILLRNGLILQQCFAC